MSFNDKVDQIGDSVTRFVSQTGDAAKNMFQNTENAVTNVLGKTGDTASHWVEETKQGIQNLSSQAREKFNQMTSGQQQPQQPQQPLQGGNRLPGDFVRRHLPLGNKRVDDYVEQYKKNHTLFKEDARDISHKRNSGISLTLDDRTKDEALIKYYKYQKNRKGGRSKKPRKSKKAKKSKKARKSRRR